MNRRMLTVLTLFITLLGWGTSAFAIDEHYGYIDSVIEERNTIVTEMIITPKPDEGPPIHQVIFDDEVSGELNFQYERRFGRTQGEQLIDPSNRFAVKGFNQGLPIGFEETQKRQEEYGNFMAKKLTEHHVDLYMKSSPNARAVYELKETVSNVKLETKGGFKYRIKYKFSANEVDLIVDNPYKLGNRVTFDLGNDDVIYHLRYPITKTVAIQTNYQTKRDEYELIGSKFLGNGLTATLSGRSFENGAAPGDKEERALIGLIWRN